MNELMVKEAGEVVITGEQVDIIKSTVCKDATDSEMQLYFYDCKRRGVHPLDRLIHFTKRGGRYVPITSIDFFYQRAHATNQFAGQDETVFKGKPGSVDFEATVRVHRDRGMGNRGAWSATARWSEYYPGDQQGHMWKKMPNRMLEKCAEALALRKAFPSELSGLYVREELDQAGEEPMQRPRTPERKPDKGAAVLDKMQRNNKPVERDGVRQPEEGVTQQARDAAPPQLIASNVCQQLVLCESKAEFAAVMNAWMDERDAHSEEDQQAVEKAKALTLKRLGVLR